MTPQPEDLEEFAHRCRQFYFSLSPQEDLADYISRTLAALPPSHRASYIRVQSQLRSQAHLHHLRVRISTFHALMASTPANGSLSMSARADPASPRARVDRYERTSHFVRTWAASSGGLEPFFRGLWSVLRVQSRPKGGAGAKRVVWEVDDAVFLESGGPEFMHEAVTIMKGVLGFEDQPLERAPQLRRQQADRDRAGSDPFTDAKKRRPPKPPMSRRARREMEEDEASALLAQAVPLPSPQLLDIDEDEAALEEADLNKPRFRLWMFPAHISDEEAEDLLALFPVFRTRGKKADARLPPPPKSKGEKDAELGRDPDAAWLTTEVEGIRVLTPKVECEETLRVLRSGTGRIWVGDLERDPGWIGSTWFRFKRWWKTLFSRG